jgi:hypothetical protein
MCSTASSSPRTQSCHPLLPYCMVPSMILDTFRPEFPSLAEHIDEVNAFLRIVNGRLTVRHFPWHRHISRSHVALSTNSGMRTSSNTQKNGGTIGRAHLDILKCLCAAGPPDMCMWLLLLGRRPGHSLIPINSSMHPNSNRIVWLWGIKNLRYCCKSAAAWAETDSPLWRTSSLANVRLTIYMSHYPELGSPLRDRYMLIHQGGSINRWVWCCTSRNPDQYIGVGRSISNQEY